MKTLYGITYAQLQNLTTAELNEHMAAYATNQVRETLANLWATQPKNKSEKFLSIYMRHLLAMFNSKFDDELYAGQRALFDTEERFNFAADMTDRMGNIGILVNGMMERVMEELMADE